MKDVVYLNLLFISLLHNIYEIIYLYLLNITYYQLKLIKWHLKKINTLHIILFFFFVIKFIIFC